MNKDVKFERKQSYGWAKAKARFQYPLAEVIF